MATLPLSEEIRKCRDGPLNNPFQGKDKKVLFVCSMGILRSATAARLYSHKYNTRSCGTWDDALIPLTYSLIMWADQIVFVNKENYKNALTNYADMATEIKQKSVVLNIPDKYEHMAPQLVEAFVRQYEAL